MKTLLALVLLVAFATPTFAKEHSYETGKVISMATETVGSTCNRGLIADVHCKDQTAANYTVTIGEHTYTLRMKLLLDAGWNTDALASIAPGGEFQVRFGEHNDAFVTYTNKRGKQFETQYVIEGVK